VGRQLAEIEKVPGFRPDNEIVRNDIPDYACEIEHFDRHLVRMLELFEKYGELETG
jgi:N-sulfoglucosamine sulfohydrolase